MITISRPDAPDHCNVCQGGNKGEFEITIQRDGSTMSRSFSLCTGCLIDLIDVSLRTVMDVLKLRS